MAKMIILDTKCKEDLKWSLCEEEKLFSGENVKEKYMKKITWSQQAFWSCVINEILVIYIEYEDKLVRLWHFAA